MPRIFAVMGEAIARHVGVQAAGFVGQVFSLHDAEEIRSLVGDAGFHDVAVHVDTRVLRLPAPEAILWQYVHGTPLAGAVAQLVAAGCGRSSARLNYRHYFA